MTQGQTGPSEVPPMSPGYDTITGPTKVQQKIRTLVQFPDRGIIFISMAAIFIIRYTGNGEMQKR